MTTPEKPSPEALIDTLIPQGAAAMAGYLVEHLGFMEDDGAGAAARAQVLVLALNRFRAAGVEAERAEWQSKIHALCPSNGNGLRCSGGMLYGSDGKALGACEWPGHVAGGYT